MSKKILFINQLPPHGSNTASEQLQMAMVFGAFEQKVSLLFLNDGLYCLLKNQQTDELGFHDFSKNYKSLKQFYEISNVYVDQESMTRKQLGLDQLIIPVTLVDQTTVTALLHEHDVIFST